MSRHVANYLLAQFESLGYLERRAAKAGGRRLIHFTARGWQVVETIHQAMRDLQEEWANAVGRRQFAAFLAVLKKLSA
jgi:DNA-binding MarR family transcriptional regulator